MTDAYHDLKLLYDTIDGLLVGWVSIPPESRSLAITVTGKKTEQLLKRLWEKYYLVSSESVMIKSRLKFLESEIDSVRAANEQLTNEIDSHVRKS